MKKDDIVKVIMAGDPTIVSIDPDIKTEISRKQIDGFVRDMKKHLLNRKRVHVVMIKE